nr:translation initiation factor IF-2-like [Equus asinus]
MWGAQRIPESARQRGSDPRRWLGTKLVPERMRTSAQRPEASSSAHVISCPTRRFSPAGAAGRRQSLSDNRRDAGHRESAPNPRMASRGPAQGTADAGPRDDGLLKANGSHAVSLISGLASERQSGRQHPARRARGQACYRHPGPPHPTRPPSAAAGVPGQHVTSGARTRTRRGPGRVGGAQGGRGGEGGVSARRCRPPPPPPLSLPPLPGHRRG